MTNLKYTAVLTCVLLVAASVYYASQPDSTANGNLSMNFFAEECTDKVAV